MEKHSIFSYIGLAVRANKAVSGEFSTEKAVKMQKAALVIVAEDASENTKKLFRNKCEYYHTKLLILGTKTELGHAMGKEQRASLALLDEGFANAIEKKLELEQSHMNGGR